MNRIVRVSLAALSLCLAGSMAYAVEQVAPQGEDPPGADQGHVPPGSAPDQSLTDTLKPNAGVIAPPETGDTEIHTDVPNPGAGTDEEVIKPKDLPEAMPETAPK